MMRPETRPTQTTVHEQIRAIRENDEKALEDLYLHNYPKVERYVLDNSGSRDEAKDVFQEAFLAVWRNIQLDKFTAGESSALSAYIFRIARNKWIDQLRSRKIAPTIRMEEERMDVAMPEPLPQESNDYIEAARNAFAGLGQRCRDLLNRFYYQKQSLREIASFFNWTEPSAKNNKYRCLEELRARVKQKIQKGVL